MTEKFRGKNNRNRVKQRKEEAQQRQEKRDSLSAKDQLRRLDQRLGKGKGAIRERHRLKKQIEEEKNKK